MKKKILFVCLILLAMTVACSKQAPELIAMQSATALPEETSKPADETQMPELSPAPTQAAETEAPKESPDRFGIADLTFSGITLSYKAIPTDQTTTKQALIEQFGQPEQQIKDWNHFVYRDTTVLVYSFASFIFGNDKDTASLIEVRITGASPTLEGPRGTKIGDDFNEAMYKFIDSEKNTTQDGLLDFYWDDEGYGKRYFVAEESFQHAYFSFDTAGMPEKWVSGEIVLEGKNGVLEMIKIGLTSVPQYMERGH